MLQSELNVDLKSTQKSRLKWHARRGMLELDLILGRFVEKYLDILSNEQLDLFEHFLTQADPDLYAWLMEYEQPTNPEFTTIIKLIKLHNNI